MKLEQAPKTIRDFYKGQESTVASVREIQTDKGYFVSVRFKNGTRDKWIFESSGYRSWKRQHLIR